MTEEPKKAESTAKPQTETAAFFSSVWGKIIALLTTITMLGGIATEGISIYRNWQDFCHRINKVEGFSRSSVRREKNISWIMCLEISGARLLRR